MNTVNLQQGPLNGSRSDMTHLATEKIPTVKQQIDPWERLNDLLDAGVITAIVQSRKLRFAVRAFFPMPNGWLECAVDEGDETDDIHIVVRQSVPILVYVGKPPFPN